jgi:hypothetical protein
MSRHSDRHRADQAALVRLMLAELERIPLAPGGEFTAPAIALIRQYAQASGSLAAEFYAAAREQARARSRFTVPVAEPPSPQQVQASLSWATRALRGDGPEGAPVRRLVDGVAQRHVANTGRRTLAQAVSRDSQARAWARVPRGATTCHFCALMCSRGAVYKTRGTAGADGSRRFVGEGAFKFHDGCDCGIEPVFRGQVYEPSERVQQWERLYEDSTGDVDGKEKLRAFRRAFEGSAT